jgi:anti-sigma regulatory factor (Ser/Thr protein kinase)
LNALKQQWEILLSHLGEENLPYREQIGLAIEYSSRDPASSLTKSRIVLELIVAETFEALVNEKPGTRPLENLVNHQGYREVVDRRILERMNSIRSMANMGAHCLGRLRSSDSERVLVDLFEVLQWYLETMKVRQGAPGGGTLQDAVAGWGESVPNLELAFQVFDYFKFTIHVPKSIECALTKRFRWPARSATKALFVIRELVENSYEHGSRRIGDKMIRLRLEMSAGNDYLTVKATDDGDGFDLRTELDRARKRPRGSSRGRGLIAIEKISSSLICGDKGRTVQAIVGRKSEDRAASSPAGPPQDSREPLPPGFVRGEPS